MGKNFRDNCRNSFVKKGVFLILAVAMSMGLCACNGGSKMVTCDGCGVQIKVPADSNVSDEWIIYCDDCEKKFGLDKLPD